MPAMGPVGVDIPVLPWMLIGVKFKVKWIGKHLWTTLAVSKGFRSVTESPEGLQVWRLTLGGGLAVGPSEGNHALVHLDPDHHASALQVLWEHRAGVGLLVHGLVEEDHSADAGLDAVGREEQLAEQPAVLLRVLSIDALEALGHAAWRSHRGTRAAHGWGSSLFSQ